MARPLRLEFAGAVYHVTSRGNERRPIFTSDDDRISFLAFLGQAAHRFGWSITAWVLMTNHFHLAGVERAPDWLDRGAALAAFAPDAALAAAYYREFVEAKIDSKERLWDKVINGIYLGSEAWAKRMRKQVESKPRSTDHPRKHLAIGRPKMATILAAVGEVTGQAASVIRAMRGGPLRRLAAWIGWNEGWVTLRSIAASLRLRSEGHVSGMIRRCEREFSMDCTLLRQLDGALVVLRA